MRLIAEYKCANCGATTTTDCGYAPENPSSIINPHILQHVPISAKIKFESTESNHAPLFKEHTCTNNTFGIAYLQKVYATVD